MLGCAPHVPRVAVGPLGNGLGAFLTAHPLAAGQDIRVDEVARTAEASYHLVQVRSAEHAHRHLQHNLTVSVLRGDGVLRLERDVVALSAGDAALIPAGAVHWFRNTATAPAVALVIFTPPLVQPDSVPAPEFDSPPGGR